MPSRVTLLPYKIESNVSQASDDGGVVSGMKSVTQHTAGGMMQSAHGEPAGSGSGNLLTPRIIHSGVGAVMSSRCIRTRTPNIAYIFRSVAFQTLVGVGVVTKLLILDDERIEQRVTVGPERHTRDISNSSTERWGGTLRV